MMSIATLGPVGSDSYQAANQYAPGAELLLFQRIADVLTAYIEGKAQQAIIPVYNTREGEVKDYFRLVAKMEQSFWIDNVVLPIHLSLGALARPSLKGATVTTIVGRSSVFRQCNEYIDEHYPDRHPHGCSRY